MIREMIYNSAKEGIRNARHSRKVIGKCYMVLSLANIGALITIGVCMLIMAIFKNRNS